MRNTEKFDKAGANSLRFLYNTAVGRCLLLLLICKPVSYIAGLFLDSRLSKPFIKGFIKKNAIKMSDYEKREFNSFNDFFTRKIVDDARPVSKNTKAFLSPCDARLSAYQITDKSIFTIKGVDYSLCDLLQNKTLADLFCDGYCLIFRLAVDNYHRYGWCDSGIAEKTIHIKGKYHTVQPIAVNKYPVYRQNVREYTLLQSQNFGDLVQIEVGALMVGRICNHNTCGGPVLRGTEKGMFEFGGSTIIVLLKKDAIQLDNELLQNTLDGLETHVKYRETLGFSIK